MRKIAALGALLIVIGPLMLLSPATAADAPASATVSMKDFAFMPATITIKQGGSVKWTYDESSTDSMPNCESPVFQPPSPVTCPGHSTTAVDKGADGKPLWDSGVHRADGFPFTATFTKAGTFHYICVVHGGANANNPVTHMEGDVVVEPAPTAAPGAAPPAPSRVEAASTSRPTLATTGRSSIWAALGGLAFIVAIAGSCLRRRLA